MRLLRAGEAALIDLDLRVRVLIVDDSADDAHLARAELARRGLAIDYRRVDNAIDMAAALAAQDFDLVLADHLMPGFDAHGALEVLRRSGRELPFIIHSGQIPLRLAVSAMYEGAHDFVVKGDYARLVPVIAREMAALEERRALSEAGRRIRELSSFDRLCALPNRDLFCARVTDWLDECRRGARTPRAAVLLLDVDRFMRINTSLGYEVGSDILRQIAVRLGSALAPNALLARQGGDRFCVFLPVLADEGEAERAARCLLGAFERPFPSSGGELLLTASVGIAMVEAADEAVAELLTNAEAAAMGAKRDGGNAARAYDRSMSTASSERLRLEIDLRRAVRAGELRLHYQPIVDGANCHARGAEALVRWQHPVHGLLGPDRFIPLADESGLIVDIGAWVLAEACRQGRRWHEAGQAGFQISVNVSAIQFAQPGLLAQVDRALCASGFPASCLTLEITESTLMTDADSAGHTLRALKELGVQIAIDDFGTGYSSLAYLRRLPIDIIKIDRSFVRDLGTDDDNSVIVHATLAMAASLRLAVVAEGVETAAQEMLLQAQGCGGLQGYRYGRPVDADRFRFGSLTPDR